MGRLRQPVETASQGKWGLRRLVLLCLLLTGCAKGKPPAPAGLELQPLPPPPALQLPASPLPGAQGRLAVVAARPRGEAGADVRPTLTFSRPVLPLSTVEAQAALPPPAQLEPSVPGQWRWLGSASVVFVPQSPLPFSTR
ncbi:MAG: hypothetical protein ACLPJH_01435, partial [Myxococcaceae bacterium]